MLQSMVNLLDKENVLGRATSNCNALEHDVFNMFENQQEAKVTGIERVYQVE